MSEFGNIVFAGPFGGQWENVFKTVKSAELGTFPAMKVFDLNESFNSTKVSFSSSLLDKVSN